MLNTGRLAAHNTKNHGTRNRLFQTDDTELSRRTGTGGRTFRTRYANPKRTLTIAALSSSTKYGRAVCNRFADEEIYSMALHYYDRRTSTSTNRQLQGSGQSHRRTDRGGKSRGTAERHTEGRERSLRQVGESQVKPKKIEDNKLMPSLF